MFKKAGYTTLTPSGRMTLRRCRTRRLIPSFKRQQRNDDVTEIVKIPNRGHSLTIDGGWREVADAALKFIQRFIKP